MNNQFNLITILGPTASGKTSFAAKLAYTLNSGVISADSRQVYRGMDLGTGKDYDDYLISGSKVPLYLVDIVDAGYKYNVYEYQKDFVKAYYQIKNEGSVPVLCGGTGMYLEAVLKGYQLISVPKNLKLRNELRDLDEPDLIIRLNNYKKLHNTTDITQRKRLIRAIEIEEYYDQNKEKATDYPDIKPFIAGVKIDRESRRQRISNRLKSRLDEGMIDEVSKLLKSGIDPETLIYYGLEYKYITLYLQTKLSYEEMFTRLESAIHQFSKRQMTWFRGMERRGFEIFWIDWSIPDEEKVEILLKESKILNK